MAEWQATSVPMQEELPGTGDVWLRCFVRVPENMTTPQEKDLWRDSMTLSVGGVHGPFSIWLNGQKIADGNALPPGERSRFKVPKGILEAKAFNVFAFQLRGGSAKGLSSAPILGGYFDELALEGAWELETGKPDAAELKATLQQPARAVYTEAGFRPASTPLAANPVSIPGVRLSPAESLAGMQTAEDLAVDLVLSEPLVAQPTHVSFDERGRMWVSQYRQYPFPAGLKMISRDHFYRSRFDKVPPAPPHHDRGRDVISVHEDTDGDGVYDKHKVVVEGLNMANSAVRGHGGFWVMHTPYLLFYPDADGDDVPDRDPEVRLAGFGLEDTHSVANGLAWGPDGWLYGAQGSTTTCRIVRPDVDPEGFVGDYYEGGMVWRYHPRTKAFEIFAEGGGNVFGLDFDAQGRVYSGHNGGDTRGWHYVQSGLFLKQGVDPGKFGPSGHPYAFGQLEMMPSKHPIPRFTHATIVAEGTALPAHYTGRFFGADPLHRTIMVTERYSRGSTFETSDSGTALSGADPAFRPVYLTNAPDGAIYAADFYEEFIAHGQNYQGQLDPSTGRIFRLRGKESTLNKDVNLADKSSAELVALLEHPNRWHRQTAVRLLGERRDPASIPLLHAALAKTTEHPALEALWALHQAEALDEATSLKALAHGQPAVRAWAIRLAGDQKQLSGKFAAAVLALMAKEPDAEVRAQIASTARRLPATQALPLVAALLQHAEDIADPYIPLLCWWTLESHCATERDAVLASLDWKSASTQKHILPRLMRRFAAAGGRTDLITCAHLLQTAPAPEQRQLLMSGFEEAFKGRALPPLPEPLVEALDQHGLASPHLRVRLGEPQAIADAIKVAGDAQAKPEERLLCVQLFGEVKITAAVPGLLRIAAAKESAELRKAALSSLQLYEEPAIGEEIARLYPTLPADVQPAAQTLLTSRTPWTLAFLRLIEAGSAQASTVPATTAVVLRQHQDKTIAALAEKIFEDSPQASAKDQQPEIDRIRRVLAAGPGDPYKGEATFAQRCAACHKLFFKGGAIGPDLTAYQRDDLGTLLPSIVTPSAEIREGFVNQILTTKDGRTLTGFIPDQDGSTIILRGLDGQDVSIERDSIQELRAAAASLMPEGLLTGLTDQELRDFFAYLRIPQPFSK